MFAPARNRAICSTALPTASRKSGERQKRVLGAKAEARAIPFEEMEKLALSLTSLKEYVTPQQLADLVAFVASPRGKTISGQALSVCGDTNMLT